MTRAEPPRRRSSGEVSALTTAMRARATADDAALAPGRNVAGWFWRTLVDVVRKGDRDRLLGLAAESAFFAVLTLFPALLVVAAVLGQLGTFIGSDAATRVENAVLEFLDKLLTDTARPAVDTVRSLFDGSGNLLTLATLLALVSLSTAFATLVNTLNIAYDVPETRGWWHRRFLGLVLGLGSVLTGAIAVTVLVIGPLFGRGVDVVAQVGLSDTYTSLWQALRWPLAFGSLVLWATTVQHLSPADRHRWRHDLPGGLLTATLWLAASMGLNVYLTYVVPASPVLGALGGGLILMTWFYLLMVALLGGGELNAVLAARRRERERRARDREEADAEQQARAEVTAASEQPPDSGAASAPADQPSTPSLSSSSRRTTDASA